MCMPKLDKRDADVCTMSLSHTRHSAHCTVLATCEHGIAEFAGLENDGLEHDGVEQEETYILHTMK